VAGTLYHCDSLVQNGKVVFAVASEYLYPNIEFQKGKVYATIPLQETDPLTSRIKDFSEKTLNALGLIDGATHMEIFHNPRDELVFLEVAARPPGALIFPNYEKIYGFNLFDAHFKIQIGEIPKIPKIKIKEYSFSGVIPRYKGKVLQLHPPNITSRYEIKWKIKPGDIIEQSSQNILQLSATFYVYNSNYNVLYQDFKKLYNYKPIDVEPL
jgi:biotin carboxylase